MPARPSTDLVKVDDIARMTKTSPATIIRLAESGKIPVVRMGRLVRFHPPSVLEALLAGSASEKKP